MVNNMHWQVEQHSPDQLETIEDVSFHTLKYRLIKDKQYHLLHKIGSGGYSVVYLAENKGEKPRTYVAIKCVLYNTLERRAHFAREVELHKRASDIPGVAPLLDTVIEKDVGMAFLVMEYIPGRDLFEVMVDQRLFAGRDDIIRSTFLQLLDTVETLHSRGIFHRDLKPENIMCNVTPQDGFQVYITDFGLATENEESTNFGVGSYYYMLPECLVGAHSSLVKSFSSRASDIWALGIILINLLTAKNPWKVALKSDPSFLQYKHNKRYLEQIFPFSRSTSRLLNRIFSRHGCDVSLPDLRTRILAIDSFYMTPEEVAGAPKTVRMVAAEWMRGVPMHDFKPEDLANAMLIDNITEAQLFEDDKPIESSPTATDISTLADIIMSTPGWKTGQPTEDASDYTKKQNKVLTRANTKFTYTYKTADGSLVETDYPAKGMESWLLKVEKHWSDRGQCSTIQDQ